MRFLKRASGVLRSLRIMKKFGLALFGLCLLLPVSGNAAEGGYIQASYTVGTGDDISAAYYSGANVNWGLDTDKEGSATLGWTTSTGIGMNLKVNYAEGAVETIDSVAATDGDNFNYGAATIGLTYEIERFVLQKGYDFALVPHVGVGIGYDAGYMDGKKNTDINCGDAGPPDCAGGDNRNDSGTVYRISVGGLLELHKNLGINLNYDYLSGIVDSHIGSAGIRLMF